ncbi:hypothetical protein EVAR_69400_1 [Eumeta japonica]|uniref:Uncharacterized protein n=1 Tax=Eumeta variegata TaxID=151549 RepID=A0A4C1ZZG2_EUMVA|nr:hypothetical protein EVAR_69400_1 [Eumeta japonica]
MVECEPDGNTFVFPPYLPRSFAKRTEILPNYVCKPFKHMKPMWMVRQSQTSSGNLVASAARAQGHLQTARRASRIAIGHGWPVAHSSRRTFTRVATTTSHSSNLNPSLTPISIAKCISLDKPLKSAWVATAISIASPETSSFTGVYGLLARGSARPHSGQTQPLGSLPPIGRPTHVDGSVHCIYHK